MCVCVLSPNDTSASACRRGSVIDPQSHADAETGFQRAPRLWRAACQVFADWSSGHPVAELRLGFFRQPDEGTKGKAPG